LLVHDLLLAKRGISLPAAHGLKAATERHKARLQAELTKARIRRKLSTMEAFKAHIETGLENSAGASDTQHPRWIRVNTVKASLDDQLEKTFIGLERVMTVNGVRKRGSKALYIDENVPNLVAISPSVDLTKSDAYKAGEIIFQDKASCFPAYLLDPLPEDGDVIDGCAAPGNKTTHLASILLAHSSEPDECKQVIHAFEKNKGRAETLDKMVGVAGSDVMTILHPGQDFLKTDPDSATYKNVGALLLDPSCSGSGIIGRDEMPELHLPVLKEKAVPSHKTKEEKMKGDPNKEIRKRKREDKDDLGDVMIDDDGVITAVNTDDELKARLSALSTFQYELLLHAFRFPAARKLTYSTCSIHAEENEHVVRKALQSAIAKERGWRILKREEQIRGMRVWPVRGDGEACEGNEEVREACIRANKDDVHGTMGFFLAGFTRDGPSTSVNLEEFLRDETGHLVRDVMGIPIKATEEDVMDAEEADEWGGFGDENEEQMVDKAEANAEIEAGENIQSKAAQAALHQKKKAAVVNKHAHSAGKKRADLVPKGKKRKMA
jgi:putative methyltransferase